MRVFCPTDQGLVGGGTHFLPQTHTHKHDVLCMFLNKAAKIFPSLIIWLNNYYVGGKKLSLHLVIIRMLASVWLLISAT